MCGLCAIIQNERHDFDAVRIIFKRACARLLYDSAFLLLFSSFLFFSIRSNYYINGSLIAEHSCSWEFKEDISWGVFHLVEEFFVQIGSLWDY